MSAKEYSRKIEAELATLFHQIHQLYTDPTLFPTDPLMMKLQELMAHYAVKRILLIKTHMQRLENQLHEIDAIQHILRDLARLLEECKMKQGE